MPPTTIDRYAPADPRLIDRKIAHPLGKLRGIIRRYVTIEGVLALLLFLAVWFWTAMIIDYGVFKLFAFDWALEAPKALRAIALVLAVGGLIALLVTKIVLRLTRDFSNSALALVLEKRYPKLLGDRLITAVQLSDLEWAKQYGYSTEMIQKTIDDVREKIDEVPVSQVFNWRRLWVQAGLFVALTAGFFVLSGAAICAITQTSPKKYVQEFSDVSAILVERDVLLMNTAWPRRAYLEVVKFPESGELRIGRDMPSPRIRVAAYKWVIADSSAPIGWRPMTWADMPKMTGSAPPALPLQPVRDARFAVDYGPFLYSAAPVATFTPPTLPGDVADVPDDPKRWPVDRVEQVFLDDEAIRSMLSEKSGDELAAIRSAVDRLVELAADPGMSRKLRKLKIPDEVELYYWGAKTRVDMKLRAEPNNEFSGTLSDLKESVKFYARGENYDTPTRLITLVPPPMLTELKRDEYHPAYLYHKAPYAEAKDLPNEQKPYSADPTKLKGLKHVLKEQAVSLTGDKSRFDIPLGSEFVLYGKSDKPLVEAKILPKPGKFPGIEAEISDPDPIPLPIEGQHNIRYDFTAANNKLVTRQTEFDIFLRDTDNVTSKRTIQIVVEEDRPPDVDVVVDVIRKQGAIYICTPQALIPFTKESKIRDDKGLNRVDYVFSYYEVEPMAVTVKRAEFATWYFNSAPVFPTIGDVVYRTIVHHKNEGMIRPSTSTIENSVPVPGFLEAFTKRPLALADIQARLEGPRPTGADKTVEDIVTYPPDAVREEIGFDLRKVAPGLRRATENEAQRNYILTLNVVAVDTNVEAARPGIAQNKETLVFKLVSDGELLTEIAKEEANLADKLDDAIRRLADVDNKLRSMVARFPGLSAPESFTAEQTRANELHEQLGKAKDVTSEVFTDYSRILLEFRANRLPEHLIKDVEGKVVNRLGEVLNADFPQTEEAYGKVHGELAASRKPEVDISLEAQNKVTMLLTKLRMIRSGIGQGLDIKKLITQAEELIKQKQANQLILALIEDRNKEKLKTITVKPGEAPITINGGQKVNVRIPIEIGPAYNGDFKLKVEPTAGSDLKVPGSVEVLEDSRDFQLEITAGFTKGNHSVRITPDIGDAKDVKVIVK
jgi:hypothetical protein